MAIDQVSGLSSPGLIVRGEKPLNLEFPFGSLDSFLTPTAAFYVRNHFAIPDLDKKSYELSIDGAVEIPLALSYDDLRCMPSETLPATLECAGNSRAFLEPTVDGVPWERGAVGTAEWTGIRLCDLLDRVRPLQQAYEVVFEGADRGTVPKPPRPVGSIAYARSLPLSKARQAEVLIAFQMNGQDLTPEHGWPIRAIVPGYYGMASVKWLTRIHVVECPFTGYWQTTEYAYWDTHASLPSRHPLREAMLKSLIARPSPKEQVPAASVYEVVGAAWSGVAEVVDVELSVDGGHSWRSAEFLDPVRPFAWRRWRYAWRTPDQPMHCKLMARARDANGCTQPEEHDRRYEGYSIRHVLPVNVFVTGH